MFVKLDNEILFLLLLLQLFTQTSVSLILTIVLVGVSWSIKHQFGSDWYTDGGETGFMGLYTLLMFALLFLTSFPSTPFICLYVSIAKGLGF
jgi:hypothetical protein